MRSFGTLRVLLPAASCCMYVHSGRSTVKKETPELSHFTFLYTQHKKENQSQDFDGLTSFQHP